MSCGLRVWYLSMNIMCAHSVRDKIGKDFFSLSFIFFQMHSYTRSGLYGLGHGTQVKGKIIVGVQVFKGCKYHLDHINNQVLKAYMLR